MYLFHFQKKNQQRKNITIKQVKTPLYVTKITSNLAAETLSRARRRGILVYGEALASSLGCSLHNVKLPNQLYYITCPPIRTDPETPRQLMKHLVL